MTTEAQHAAATALFTAISQREMQPVDRDALFDLYRQCLGVVSGDRPPAEIRRVEISCPACGERTELDVPVG